MSLLRSVALFLPFCALVLAQSPLGTITGTITDPQGAGVEGVEVVARNTGTNQTFRGSSTGDGTYAISSIAVGPYELTVSHPGFKRIQRTSLNSPSRSARSPKASSSRRKWPVSKPKTPPSAPSSSSAASSSCRSTVATSSTW